MIERLQKLFHQALELEPAERGAFIRRECGDDEEMRARLQSFLGAHEMSDEFLANPTLAADGSRDDFDSPIPETAPGTKIGRYTVVRPIGEGGYGVVLLAEQREPVEREVALKVLKLGMESQEGVARFEAERQALALMSHPEIATVLDGGVTGSGRPYFVMELVDGEPITEFCERRAPDVSDRLALFARVCRAVQHAHQKGIIHRDIKPSNVLVSEGQPPGLKIIDFGIAKATSGSLAEREQVTGAHQFVGTPTYVSPEQATRSESDVDTRSDIYSLGVLLYELLTGTTPIEVGDLRQIGLGEVLRRIREETPPKPSTRLATAKHEKGSAGGGKRQALSPFRGDLDWIVMRAIEKDPSRRYGSAEDFARDVIRFQENRPVEARPPTAMYRFRKFVNRHKAGAAAACVAVVALLAGLGMAAYGLVRAKQEAEAARLQAERANAVIGLIDEMFDAADPLMMRGSDYTVRQLLDDFDREFDGRLEGQEEVERSLRLTIGSAYEGLAEHEIAERHYRRAMELTAETHDPGSPEFVRLRRKIAGCQRNRGLYLAALEELAAVMASPDSPRGQLETKAMMVDVHRLLGHQDEANALADTFGGSWRQVVTPDGPSTLRMLDILAMARSSDGQHAEAERLGNDALSLAAELYGERHPRLIHPLDTLAVISEAAGLGDRAAEFARRGREIARETLPAEHPARLFAESRVQELSLATEPESAAGKLVPMTAILAEKIGERPEVFSRVLKTGVNLFSRGKDDEAVKFFVDRLGIDYEAIRSGQTITVDMAGPLVGRIIREGRVANYIPHIESALKFAKQIWGESGEHTIEIKRLLAYMYRWDRRYDDAEALARDAYEFYSSTRGQENGATINAANDLGDLLEEAGRMDDKWAFYLGDLDGRRDEIETARLAAKLGRHFSGVGRRLEAQRLLEASLEIRRRKFGDKHPETIKSLRYLGHLYYLQNSTRGYDLLLKAVAASREVHGDVGWETAKCVDIFGEACLHLTGNQIHATQLTKEVLGKAKALGASNAVTDRLAACIVSYTKGGGAEQKDGAGAKKSYPDAGRFRLKAGALAFLQSPPPRGEFRERFLAAAALAGEDDAPLRALAKEYGARSSLVRGDEPSFINDLWTLSQHLDSPRALWKWLGADSHRDRDDTAGRVPLVAPGNRWLSRVEMDAPSEVWPTAEFGETVIWVKSDLPVTDVEGVYAGRHFLNEETPPTVYLRTTFDVVGALDFDLLQLSLLHQSGVEVYLNGDKVAAVGPVSERKLELAAPLQQLIWESYPIDPGALRQGENVLALAIHRVGEGGGVYLDCSLDGVPRKPGS